MIKTLALLTSLLLLLCGCALPVENQTEFLQTKTSCSSSNLKQYGVSAAVQPEAANEEFRGAWVSYTELNPNRLTDEKAYRAYLRSLLLPLQTIGIRDLFVQVRPFADAIYPSELFPSAASVASSRGAKLPFDCFAVILETANEMKFRVHAWINPYRVSSDSKNKTIFQSDPVLGKWMLEPKQRDVLWLDTGIFLNPSSSRAQALILDGVRELLDRYSFSGLHLDDYFYPTADSSFDAPEYTAYRKNGGTLSQQRWRTEHVSALIRSLYAVVKAHDSSMLVSISPAADIEKDLKLFCADVRLWANERGYCDMLIPQIYFGFQNESKPFRQVAKQWKSLCKNKCIRLCAGLAAYKIGQTDSYAGSGSLEWKKNTDILAKQVQCLRKLGYDGFSLFSAQFVNFRKKLVRKAFQTLQDVV